MSNSFVRSHARRGDPSTSHEAAEDVAYKVGSQKETILQLFQTGFVGNDAEGALFLRWKEAAFRKRRSDVYNDGHLEPHSIVKGPRGSKMIRWRLKRNGASD